MDIAVGAVDAVAARTVQEIPECTKIWISSFEVSCSLGLPDNDALSPDDLIGRIQLVVGSSVKPLIIDMSNSVGYSANHFATLVESTQRSLTFVVDNTVHPRANSFSDEQNVLLSPAATQRRLLSVLRRLSSQSPQATLCLRTESYLVTRDYGQLLNDLKAIFAAPELEGCDILVHGYDTVREGLDRLKSAFPTRRFMTLSTLSPRASITQFENEGVDTLIIPNILTVQRVISGKIMLERIMKGLDTIDGPFPPFKEILGQIEM